MKKKLIIDTDGVSDDMRAISLAIQHPNVELIAITTVHGCVPVEQATANVARVQRANGVVVLSSDFAAYESESAALALIRLTKEHKDVTIATIGPLTNIALAYKLDPDFARRIEKLVILGGNYYGVGNVDEFSSSEFNFNGDPEAAKIVLEEMNTDIILVPWENVYLKGAEHEEEVDFDAHLKVETPLASFLSLATKTGREIMRKYGRQYGYCDEVAVSIAIDEKAIIKKAMNLRLSVELHGELTRGQVVVDWTGILCGPNGTITEARIVKDSDRARRHTHVVVDFDVKVVDEWMHNTVRGKRSPWLGIDAKTT